MVNQFFKLLQYISSQNTLRNNERKDLTPDSKYRKEQNVSSVSITTLLHDPPSDNDNDETKYGDNEPTEYRDNSNGGIVNSGEFGAQSEGEKPIGNRPAGSNFVTNFSSIDYKFQVVQQLRGLCNQALYRYFDKKEAGNAISPTDADLQTEGANLLIHTLRKMSSESESEVDQEILLKKFYSNIDTTIPEEVKEFDLLGESSS